MLTLLLAEGLDDAVGGSTPLVIEWSDAAGGLPVAVRKPDGVAERIDLPFALADAGEHIGFVMHGPGEWLVASGTHECVGVRVERMQRLWRRMTPSMSEASCLSSLRKRKVGPHLRGRIAQPHRVDVSGDNEGIGLAFVAAGEDGSVERVGQAVAEHQPQLRIGDARADACNGRLDGGAGEAALAGRGALVKIGWLDLRQQMARRRGCRCYGSSGT